MQSNKIKTGFIIFLLSIFFIACKKNVLNLSDNLVNNEGAYLKMNWLSPSFNTQGVQLKINGTRVSNLLGLGFTSTTQYVMPFPGGGLNTGGNNKNDYLLVNAGTINVTLSVPKKRNK